MAFPDQTMAHARTYPEAGSVRALVPPQDATTKDASAQGQVRVPADIALSVAFDLAPLETEWRRLQEVGDCTVFQCFDWLAAWQRHIGRHTGTRPVIVLGRGRSQELLFILPLAVNGSGPIRKLTFLGRELCDYNAPLLATSFAEACSPHAFGRLWADIRGLLAEDPRSRHDIVLLDKMPERVGDQPNPLMQLAVELNPSGAYLTSLSAATWEAFYKAKRSSATRRRDRTKRKRLAESGEVCLVTPEDPAEIAQTLTALIEQKRRAFARMGVADIFARPDQRDFYLDIATNSSARGLVHVSRLQVGSAFAAINLGLEFRGGYYHVLASYDEGPLSRFGPGAAHLHDLMRRALERGCRLFDFTIGDEPYKRDWCDAETRLFDHVAAATPRGWAVAKAVAGTRRVKRSIKQSAVLWPAVLRLRATLASITRQSAPEKPDESSERASHER